MLIGLAGRTGSGKNYVASLLEERGWRTLDLDLVAHEVLADMAGDIEAEIGPGLLNADRTIDRARLGARVFADAALLIKLEELTYPEIEARTGEWLAADQQTPAAVHAINLHKTSLQHRLDAVIWIQASRRIRRKRVMDRDGRSWKELKGRFRAQNRLNPKLFSPDAEIYSVRNSGNRRSLQRRLENILSRL